MFKQFFIWSLAVTSLSSWFLLGSDFSPHAPDAILIERFISPQVTDPAIDNWLEPHVVYFDPEVAAPDMLFVHLPGSFGVPENSRLILREVARQGVPAIGLRYPNSWTVARLCRGSSDPTCHERVRGEILDGEDRTPLVTITPANSIEHRLLSLLRYLSARYPDEGWERFFEGEELDWSKLIVSGHSQGGGHAAFIAKVHEVARVVMFASPGDHLGEQPAPWLHSSHVTPAERYFGFSHRRDRGWPSFERSWEALGLDAFGPPRSVDEAAPPYGDSHQLYTDALPATGSFADAHGAVVVDRKTPRWPDGRPRFAPVWRYLCCSGKISTSSGP